ncbi:MAG: tetratricopeptide repeat protein, partial [Pseudomonadota bacterium]
MHQEPIGPDALATASAAETLRAAKRLVSVGKPDAAAVVLSALLKRFPGNRKARGLLAEIEATPPALPLAKTPEERIVIERLHAATASQRHCDMLKLAQALLPAHPNCALLQNILGVAHAALGDHGSAVALYQRALQLRTDYAEAAFNLGVSHQEKGEAREALAAYRRALKHGPKRA